MWIKIQYLLVNYSLCSFYFSTLKVLFQSFRIYTFRTMKQQLLQHPTKNLQYYLSHTFSLSDLQALIQPYQSFRYIQQPLEINPDQNFTFETLQYSLQLYYRPQNHTRIIYYALLTSIYESGNILLKDKSQQILQKIVLQNFDVILPFKNTFKKGQKNISTIITTNQIKSSFVKFLQLLNSSNQKPKVVLAQIIKLPQIDFIFMSIFQMYFSKNYQTLNQKLEIIGKDFGVKTQIDQNGFQIQDFFFQIKERDEQNWQMVSVKKQQSSKFKKQINLKRRGTAQSIGQIQQDHLHLSQDQVNQGLNCQQLINARFVQSCQSQNFFDLQNQTISQEVIQFVWDNQTPKVFKTLKQNTNLQDIPKQQTKKIVSIQKKTTFLNQNINPPCFSKYQRIQRKPQKIKSAPLYLFENSLNERKFPQNFFKKEPRTQKQIKAQNNTKVNKLNAESKTLSSDIPKNFLNFSRKRQNGIPLIVPTLAKNFSQRRQLTKTLSSKFFLSTVASTS